MTFRQVARDAVARAKERVALPDPTEADLRYAALDARLAMEALTYERAERYRDQLPKAAYATWQPRKLLQLMLDIDPHADADRGLRFGKQVAQGIPAEPDHDLGTEVVLNMKVLKGHYDRLGSFLHLASLDQLENAGGQKFDHLAVRLAEIFAYLDRVLSSPIFNVDIAQFAEMACGNCQETIRWRLPRDPQAVQAVCRECEATYQIDPQADGSIHWIPEETEAPCAHEDCRAGGKLFTAHIRAGQPWKCHACGQSNRIALCVEALPNAPTDD
jgi:hypothetical protein